MPAGELRRRFTFFAVTENTSDPGGGKRGDPIEQFTIWGKLVNLRGGEAVTLARLQSQQPANLFIRQTARTRQITADWQVEDDTGTLYNIRTINDPDQRRRWFELFIESGVAA